MPRPRLGSFFNQTSFLVLGSLVINAVPWSPDTFSQRGQDMRSSTHERFEKCGVLDLLTSSLLRKGAERSSARGSGDSRSSDATPFEALALREQELPPGSAPLSELNLRGLSMAWHGLAALLFWEVIMVLTMAACSVLVSGSIARDLEHKRAVRNMLSLSPCLSFSQCFLLLVPGFFFGFGGPSLPRDLRWSWQR